MTATTRVDTALDALTFTQRVGQLNQRLLGWRAVERGPRGWRLSDEGKSEIQRWGGLGALYGLFRADAWSGRGWSDGIRPEERREVAELVQAEVRAASGIGVLLSEEAPHGHQALGGSILPVSLSAAATFDTDLVADANAAVATQLAASGVHLALVSTLDLLRDPRWGRSEECFGEDPHLASAMTTAVVEGMQGVARSRIGIDGVGVVLKHLAAQGEATGGRNGQSSVLGPRDLEELHLPMVEAGVRAGAVSFMAAYNDIDGVPCCANPALLRGLLRGRYGFDGAVMADGLAVDRLAAMTGDVASAGRLALLSGIDLSLWDEGFTTLVDAEHDPLVRAAVDDACRRVLQLKELFGLLGDATPAPAPDLASAFQRGERASSALADASMVLLDDGGTLPWNASALREVVVAGPYADEPTALLGDYVAPTRTPSASVADALRDALPGVTVRVARDEAEAARLAPEADAVVVVLGGTSHRSYEDSFDTNGAATATTATSGEGVDLADLDLPVEQRALLRAVSDRARGPVATVIVAGRPHVLTPVVEAGTALLWAGFPGPHGGAAIARALLGHRSPTGRLPFTAPSASGVVPVRHNDRHDPAGIYRDAPDPVLFAFGSGGGYADATVESIEAAAVDGGVQLDVSARNPHAVRGDLVVPVYARRGGGNVLPRRRELVAVLRRRLAPGTTEHFALFIPDGRVRVDPPTALTRLRLSTATWAQDLILPLLDPARETASRTYTP